MTLYTAQFTPTDYLNDAAERDVLMTIGFDHGFPRTFNLWLARRRGSWMSTLPAQVWNRDRYDITPEEEEQLRLQLENVHRAETGAYGYLHTRDIVLKEGCWVYRDSVLSALMPRFATPLLAKAVMNFMHAAEDMKRGLVKHPARDEARKALPPEQRAFANGRRHRGPEWKPEHDYVIRKWFGRHEYGPNAGKHVALTEAQWAEVLKELGGQRSKSEVRRRIRVLNDELRMSLMVNGYVPRTDVDKYMAGALGEGKVRLPRLRAPLRAQR